MRISDIPEIAKLSAQEKNEKLCNNFPFSFISLRSLRPLR